MILIKLYVSYRFKINNVSVKYCEELHIHITSWKENLTKNTVYGGFGTFSTSSISSSYVALYKKET
jgi:hypothetical protein